jgi:hypothetical protein
MTGMRIGQELQVITNGKGRTMIHEEITKWQTDQTEIFEYLDALRESGATNMYGAGVYLQERFNFSKQEAREFLMKWMAQYGEC